MKKLTAIFLMLLLCSCNDFSDQTNKQNQNLNQVLSRVENKLENFGNYKNLNLEIDRMNNMFSLNLPSDLSKVIELSDKRALLLRRWSKALSNDDSFKDLLKSPLSISNIPTNPYSQVFFFKAISMVRGSINIKEDFFLEIDNGLLKGIKEKDTSKQYQGLNYLFEISKIKLELITSSESNQHIFKDQKLRREIYFDLKGVLEKILKIRFPEDQSSFDWKRLTRDISQNKYTLNVNIESKTGTEVTMAPGIYHSSKDIIIRGNVLKFHPLTMISAPGKKIEINAHTVENLWIDTSGGNPIEAKPKKDTKHFEPGVYGRAKMERDLCNRYTRRVIFKEFHYQKIKPPVKQANGLKGHKGGDIFLKLENTNNNDMPLLVSMGGLGGNGIVGFDSPKCINPGCVVEVGKVGRKTVERDEQYTRVCDYKKWDGPYSYYPERTSENVAKIPQDPEGEVYIKIYLNRRENIYHVGNVKVKINPGVGGDGGVGGNGGVITVDTKGLVSKEFLNVILDGGIGGNKGDSGKVGRWGISNYYLEELEALNGVNGSAGHLFY